MPRFYEGPPSAKIAIVSEAPGPGETKCFAGKSGYLFKRIMQKAGITPQDVYIDHVFQEAGPKGDTSIWLDVSKKYVVESDVFRRSVEDLEQRLAHTEANVIVALGNVALYALCGKKGITKQRGSILQGVGGFSERKVVACIHPSAIQRQYLWGQLVQHDLGRARDESFSPIIRRLERNLQTMPSFGECLAYIAKCRASDHVAYDIEVMRGEVSHLSLATDAASAICIPFSVSGDNYFSPPQEVQLWKEIAGLLEDEKVAKIGQNLSFDSTFLYRKLGIHTRPMDDTMIAQAIIFPDFPKGLDFIQSMYCNGEPYYKDDGKEWFRYAEGEEAFRRYSAMDSAIVAEAWPRMAADLRNTGNWETYQRQKGLLESLVFIGERGIRMDLEGMGGAANECASDIKRLEADLWKLTDDTINWKSPQQLKTYFYVTKGLPAYTKKGSVTTDDKALKRLAAKGHREADLILKLRGLAKLHGTYYTMQLDTDGRLRCSYNPVGTKQGRISSSKTIFGTGGNLQNQPPAMKKLMLADPGYLMVAQDLSQAENRVVAVIANEAHMLHAFENGIDIHRQTAAMIYGVEPDDVTDDQRSWGKRANHGLNYDLGYRSFSLYYQLPEEESRFLVERYHQIYPGVRRWHAVSRNDLQKTRALVNLYGRKRIFLERWGDELFKEAYSFVPQSTVAELMNQSGVRFVYERQDLFPEVELLNTVHDSLIYQVPISVGPRRIAEIITQVKENLEKPLRFQDYEFSIPVDTKVGFNLDEATMTELKAKDSSPDIIAKRVEETINGRTEEM